MTTFSIWASMNIDRHMLHKHIHLCSRMGNSERINFIFEIFVLIVQNIAKMFIKNTAKYS